MLSLRYSSSARVLKSCSVIVSRSNVHSSLLDSAKLVLFLLGVSFLSFKTMGTLRSDLRLRPLLSVLEDLLGLGKSFIVAGKVKLAEFSMLVEEVSILSGFPGPPGPPPLIGMIFAGESFRGIGGILSSLSIVKS